MKRLFQISFVLVFLCGQTVFAQKKSGLTAIPVGPAQMDSSTSTFAQSSDGSATLQGAVEHSQKLAPLDKKFQEGNTYNPDLFSSGKVQSGASVDVFQSGVNQVDAFQSGALTGGTSTFKLLGWYRLPNEYAGQYRRELETSIYRENFSTRQVSADHKVFKSVSTETFGKQKDKQGGVWDFDQVPFVKEVDMGDRKSIFQVEVSRPTYIGSDKFVKYSRAKRLLVRKSDRKIISSNQVEGIVEFKAIGENITYKSSVKSFDQNGKPLNLSINQGTYCRYAPFVPINANKQCSDLKQNLRLFLKEKGFLNLIPD